MEDKIKINVNLNGKDYLEYRKYIDEKKSEWFAENKTYVWGFVVILCLIALVISVIGMLNPSQSTSMTWEGIGMFLAISMGLAWMFHGFGFILIRR